jgi:hypothetical protein
MALYRLDLARFFVQRGAARPLIQAVDAGVGVLVPACPHPDYASGAAERTNTA